MAWPSGDHPQGVVGPLALPPVVSLPLLCFTHGRALPRSVAQCRSAPIQRLHRLDRTIRRATAVTSIIPRIAAITVGHSMYGQWADPAIAPPGGWVQSVSRPASPPAPGPRTRPVGSAAWCREPAPRPPRGTSARPSPSHVGHIGERAALPEPLPHVLDMPLDLRLILRTGHSGWVDLDASGLVFFWRQRVGPGLPRQ